MAGGRRFVRLLLLCSVSVFTVAFAHEAHGKDGTKPNAGSVKQEEFLDDNVHAEMFIREYYRLRGKKLMAAPIDNETKLKGGNNARIGTSSMGVSANTRMGKKCEEGGAREGKARRRVECKQRLNGRLSPEEVDGATFVAFNADYNAPRHHPPKNN